VCSPDLHTGDLTATRDEAALKAARAMVAKKMANVASAPLCIDAVARATGPVADLDHSGDPYLDQFIHGRAEGPIAAVR